MIESGTGKMRLVGVTEGRSEWGLGREDWLTEPIAR